ncbi:MAG TPA: HAMP domain-containing sensor histidine kinase [Pseudonocardiaceae bacterium]|nr:HAMP domain-containing sensor histidine kinase [Pseudonocardiaceae bacterium]
MTVISQPPIHMSLGTRIAMFAAVAVGITVALVSLGAYLVVRASLYRQLDAGLVQRANIAVTSPLAQQSVLEAIPAAAFGAADVRVALVFADGRRAYARGALVPPIGPAEFAVARGDLQSRPRTEGDWRVVAVPARAGVALVIAQPLDPTKQTLGSLTSLFVLVGGAGIIIAAVAGAAVARAGLRPVQELTAATENIARTGVLAPIPVSGDDELARLTYSFNVMLAALAESRERQRRLVADAGHELRTPLTSLRTNLDLLIASSRAGAPRLPEAERTAIYDDVRAQVGELTNLVGDLVELARDDVPLAVHEPVELGDVIERAVDRARRRAPGITFDVRMVPWQLLGDANALERAVLNLLDNAAKWSPPGGVVRLDLRAAGDGTAVLDVADAGPGIADDDLPHVFDRFYRSVHARTMPGSGLGLAIVKQVAERHGGAVVATRPPEGGALLRVHLPGTPPTP